MDLNNITIMHALFLDPTVLIKSGSLLTAMINNAFHWCLVRYTYPVSAASNGGSGNVIARLCDVSARHSVCNVYVPHTLYMGVFTHISCLKSFSFIYNTKIKI